MSTTYANRANNRRHQPLHELQVTAQGLLRGREVIEAEVSDFLLSGHSLTRCLPESLVRQIAMFMRLSPNDAVQQQAHRNFMRALLDAYGPQSAARTCAVPMEFMTVWAEYLLDPECPDTKTSDDLAEELLFLWYNGGTLIEKGMHPANLKISVDRLTAAVGRLEMSRSPSPQDDAVSAAGGFWGNVEGHWTNTRAR